MVIIMKINFVKYDGISGYARVMYNDVKDSDINRIEVAYSGKDIKALLEYLFSLEEKINKAIEYIKEHIRIDEEYPAYTELLIEEKDELLNILRGNNE